MEQQSKLAFPIVGFDDRTTAIRQNQFPLLHIQDFIHNTS
jgi:hypothetical protein